MWRLMIGLLLIAIGISALTGYDISRFIFPLFVIAVGLVLLTNESWHDFKQHHPANDPKAKHNVSSELNEVLVFTGVQKSVETVSFSQGKIIAIFSGAEIDLSQAKTSASTIHLELVTILGGIRLKVPDNWEIKSEVSAVLGGFDNRTRVMKGKIVTVRVTGAAVLGEIELFN